MPHPFHWVDVFAEEPYAGNPLAVVLDASDLDGSTMQRIAFEANFSETTFVTSREPDGAFRTRIFTPAAELPFAGHPTIGTAAVIRDALCEDEPERIDLSLGVGRVPVRFETGDDGVARAWLEAPPVTLGRVVERDAVSAALGLAPADVDPRSPAQRLDAGIGVLCVPLASRDALERARLDVARLADAGDDLPRCVHVSCAEPRDPANDLAARVFFDANGLREDPATGSATAMLGAWLVHHAHLGAREVSLRIEQGYEMGRPSLLFLRARATESGAAIAVGGRVLPVVRGTLV